MVDKINKLVGIKDRFICIARPRRSEKTVNAMMLAFYYSKNADFKELFDKMKISKSKSYLEHLNKHNMVYLILNELPKPNCTYKEFIKRYTNLSLDDLRDFIPQHKDKHLYQIHLHKYITI